MKVHVYLGGRTNAGKREVTFAVTDTGVGIPDDKKDLLFRPFSQVESSHHHSGSGLGLAICRELVDLMGGVIGCESKLGMGSTFSFTIPLGETASTGELTGDCEPVSPVTAPSLPSDWMPRLLLAEDDPINRKVMAAMLQPEHLAVDIVEDGWQALEMWRNGKYDLILMDVEMPRLNGGEVTRIIREKERALGVHTPIVAMTAHSFAEAEKICLATGIDSYISKPIDFRECLQVVGRMLGKHHQS